MFVEIEILAGPNKRPPTKADITKNIDALERALAGTPLPGDPELLEYTKSILEGIREKLFPGRY